MHTNLTYQPQPTLCYISKITTLGVATGQLTAGNKRFKITTLEVTTGQLPAGNMRFKITTTGVTLNCILLIHNVSVVIPSAVV